MCEDDIKLGLWKQPAFLFFRARQDFTCTSQIIIFQIGRIPNCSILQGDCTWRRIFSPKSRQITKGDSHTHILRFAASPTSRKESKPEEKKKHEIFINLRHIHAPFSHAPSVLGECLAFHVKSLELHLSSLKLFLYLLSPSLYTFLEKEKSTTTKQTNKLTQYIPEHTQKINLWTTTL